MPSSPYRQCDIDRITSYRALPRVKKGWRCEVNGDTGRVWGAGSGANLAVKFDNGRIRTCHPGWRMTIWNPAGDLVHKSEDE